MPSLTCIVCPMGCNLEVTVSSSDDGSESSNGISVTGNRCQRGVIYAQEEIRAPKRIVTATVSLTACQHYMRLPVKSSSPCPREKIPALLHDIYKIKVSLPVKAGDVVIADWNGEGIDIVATRTLV